MGLSAITSPAAWMRFASTSSEPGAGTRQIAGAPLERSTTSRWQLGARVILNHDEETRRQAETAQANEARERQKAQTEAIKSQEVARFLIDLLTPGFDHKTGRYAEWGIPAPVASASSIMGARKRRRSPFQ